jgi:hypothetical protein
MGLFQQSPADRRPGDRGRGDMVAAPGAHPFVERPHRARAAHRLPGGLDRKVPGIAATTPGDPAVMGPPVAGLPDCRTPGLRPRQATGFSGPANRSVRPMAAITPTATAVSMPGTVIRRFTLASSSAAPAMSRSTQACAAAWRSYSSS